MDQTTEKTTIVRPLGRLTVVFSTNDRKSYANWNELIQLIQPKRAELNKQHKPNDSNDNVQKSALNLPLNCFVLFGWLEFLDMGWLAIQLVGLA